MFVAVVVRKDCTNIEELKYGSNRGDNTWSAFIAEERAEAIEQAITAVDRWGRHRYKVLVGELTGEVRLRPTYTVVDLDEDR